MYYILFIMLFHILILYLNNQEWIFKNYKEKLYFGI